MQGLKVHLHLKKIQNFGYVNGRSNLGLNVNFRILSLHFLPFLFSLSLSLSSILLQAVFSWGENRENGKQREENRVENTVFHCLVGEGKLGRQKTWKKVFSPGPTFFILSNREEKLERKVLSQHFYTNTLFLSPLTATNTTIFLSNISKLKYNQIIIIQTQKHNFKINQIITKKKKRQKTEDRSHLTHLDCVGDECSRIK